MSKIIREHHVTAREFVIKTSEGNITCIVGKHINGAYLAIPSYGVSVELTDDGNIEDNEYRISDVFDNLKDTQGLSSSFGHIEFVSREIAEAINPYITETEQSP